MDVSDGLAGSPPVPLPEGRFEGRSAFADGVRAALACAAREGWQELVLCDFDFHDWPLGERDVEASLQAWAGRGRRLTLLAAGYDEVVRRHARFVQWRTTWDHIVQCRKAPVTDRLELPSVLWSDRWVLQRLDPQRCMGVAGSEPERRLLVREALDEWLLRRSAPAFPATTLGL
ncbi:hypothetical protein M4R22_16205 [Acidovorax sp. GBBC 3334]|uniref:hypothetical protein n=1 Tax=Acidovorax sp. GBBC 3334 TaxID=2940496 RepID=UPI00230422C1|nr:hypothetical protein [Acidovorax sp. GBBC 3334]MDA8456312.1 hypothetical protein [Acidovorax sp. GBBC 3334]